MPHEILWELIKHDLREYPTAIVQKVPRPRNQRVSIHLNTVLPYMGENSLIENEATRPAGKRGDGAAVCYHFHI